MVNIVKWKNSFKFIPNIRIMKIISRKTFTAYIVGGVAMVKTKLFYSAKTDVGVVRKDNQDWFGVNGPKKSPDEKMESYLFVVADGMGGHAYGDKASKSAVKTLLSEFEKTYQGLKSREWMKEKIILANRVVFNEAGGDPESGRRGTTLTALAIQGDSAVIGHVGDSRLYLIRDGKMTQVTEDHTWVARAVKDGVMSKKEAEESSRKHEILQAVGNKENVQVDTYVGDVRDNDIFILASDGLTGEVSDDEIQRVAENYPPEEATERLISLAKKRGDTIISPLLWFAQEE